MRATRLLGVVAAGAAIAASASIASAAPPSANQAAQAADGLTLVQVRDSLLATHYWYQQTYHGVPVLDTYYARHVDHAGQVTVADGRAAITGAISVTPAVAATQANTAALASTGSRLVAPKIGKSELAVLPGAHPTLVWAVTSHADNGEFRSLVDASTGAVVRTENMIKRVDGTGQVFDPNPVVKLQNESLVDGNNADSAVPSTAYSTVALHHLDGSGKPNGTYANIALTSGVATSATNSFVYTRSDNRFEQIEAYYAVDSVQSYIQSLGFTNVNNESQDLLPNAVTDDNSFYSPGADTITFGTGGVDDGEDAEVIWHEYGHAVQDDQVPGFGGSEEAGAIGEGFGDYLGMTMSQANSPNNATTPWACLMDWDSTSYTTGTPHCIRRTDTNKTVADKTGEVHDDGEIWSRALYDINLAFGRDKANKLILESQFSFTPSTSFASAATATVNTAQTLYGAADATTVRNAFVARGILTGTPTNDFSVAVSPTSGTAAPGGSVTATVSTATVSGSAQTVTLSTTGLPAGATATFTPASVQSGQSSTMTIAVGAATTNGTYSVTVRGTAASGTKTATYTLTVGTPPPPGCSATNSTPVAIPDQSTVESSIAVSGCTGNASATSTVEVHITHTYIGDLVVSLVAPDGTVYTLQSRTGGSTHDINTTYTVNLSSEVANGTWKLRVQDAAAGDTGTLNSWKLTLNGSPPPPGCSGTNGTDVAIADNTTVNSSIVISGCTGNASATSTAEVHIVHTYIGDLVVSLVAPDGTVYTLQNRTGGSADNIDKTFTVNLSSEVRNGTWKLRVQDAAAGDTGRIDTWTLKL